MTNDPERLLTYAHGLKGMSRRRFLTGSALGLALATDLFVTRQIQEAREEFTIIPVEDEYADATFPNARWILFPGYKTSWEEGVWIMNSLRPVLSRRARLAVMGYSNRGLDISTIVGSLRRYIRTQQIDTLYFYGHSFGGMVAVEVASRLREVGIDVRFILLDSSPHDRFDVIDQAMFDGVVYLYEAGYRVPTVLRGSYELAERIVHKNERTWSQIVDQTLEQLSPLAPSSVLIGGLPGQLGFSGPHYRGCSPAPRQPAVEPADLPGCGARTAAGIPSDSHRWSSEEHLLVSCRTGANLPIVSSERWQTSHLRGMQPRARRRCPAG